MFVGGITLTAGGAELQKDDQVRLLRDEPLRFVNDPVRDGRRGETFTVVQVNATTHKVFLMDRDAAGKPRAVNVPEDAVGRLPPNGEPEFEMALGHLRALRWKEAVEHLDAAVKLNPGEQVYFQVRLRVLTLVQVLRNVDQSAVAVQQATAQAEQMHRNAQPTKPPNPFNAGNPSQETAARNKEAEVSQLVERAKQSARDARVGVVGAINEIDRFARKTGETSPDAALALHAATDGAATRMNVPVAERPDRPSREAVVKVEGEARTVAEKVRGIRNDLENRRLLAAQRNAAELLKAMPDHRRFRTLKVEVDDRLRLVEEDLVRLQAKGGLGNPDGLLKTLTTLLARDVDSSEIPEIQTRLATKISDSQNAEFNSNQISLRKAKQSIPSPSTPGVATAVSRISTATDQAGATPSGVAPKDAARTVNVLTVYAKAWLACKRSDALADFNVRAVLDAKTMLERARRTGNIGLSHGDRALAAAFANIKRAAFCSFNDQAVYVAAQVAQMLPEEDAKLAGGKGGRATLHAIEERLRVGDIAGAEALHDELMQDVGGADRVFFNADHMSSETRQRGEKIFDLTANADSNALNLRRDLQGNTEIEAELQGASTEAIAVYRRLGPSLERVEMTDNQTGLARRLEFGGLNPTDARRQAAILSRAASTVVTNLANVSGYGLQNQDQIDAALAVSIQLPP